MVPPPRSPYPEISEETRQKKLASTKKKLRKFQKKNKLGVDSQAKEKKKKKNGSNPETITSDGCHSPEEIQDIVQLLVSNFNHSQGVALPPLDEGKNGDAEKSHSLMDGNISSLHINGEGLTSTADTKVLERWYQERAVGLEFSRLTNIQPSSKKEELEQQNWETLDQLEKEMEEKKDCE